MWMLYLLAGFVLLFVVAKIVKHRKSIEMDARAEAYRLREAAKRESEKLYEGL